MRIYSSRMKRGFQTPAEAAAVLGLSVSDTAQKFESMANRGLLYFEHKDGAEAVPALFLSSTASGNSTWIGSIAKIAINMGYYYANGYGQTLMDYNIPIARVVPMPP